MKTPEYLEFDLDDDHYRAGRIDAITQLGITMKLGSVLPALGQLMQYLETNKGTKLRDMDMNVLRIFGDAMSSMPDDAREFVVGKFMSVVHKQEGPGWMPVWDNDRKKLSYDVDLRQLLGLMARVFEHNLGSFTTALGLNLSGLPGASGSRQSSSTMGSPSS